AITTVESFESLNEPFDLGVFDGHALDRLWRQLHLRKETTLPLFLPILLVTPRQDISMITRQLWRVIDEIIFTPIEKPELIARIEVLLRARRLSLELAGKSIQLQQEVADHQEAEQALRESEERFRVVLKNAPIVVAHIDPDLRYTWIHNAGELFSTPDIIGRRDNELVADDSM
ncbi:MAG: hypothetical protein JNJ78_26510, partial [Anaerolineae bacterium]|nr:hypothetical protein [Anaerolineae bacterium]